MPITKIYKKIGHRATETSTEPGNTLPGMNAVILAHCDMIEIDVRSTSDEIPVLSHENVRKVGGHDIQIKERSLAQWTALSQEGEPALETLENAFKFAVSHSCGLLIDVKDARLERPLAKLVRQCGVDPATIVVAVPNEASRVIFKSLDPRIPLAHKIEPHDLASFVPSIVNTLQTDAVFWPPKLVTPERVAKLHSKKVVVYSGPVATPEEMRRLRDTCKVDGIVTDYPDLLSSISEH